MQRVTVHITDDARQRIGLVAKAKKKVEAEIIREAIDTGLDVIHPRTSSAKALIELAKMAKDLPSKAKEPTDISTDTAKYAFGQTHE